MRRIARLFVPVALAAVFVAGCGDKTTGGEEPTGGGNGITDLSGDEILNKAMAALDGAGSYRLKGDLVSGGTKMALDIKASGDDMVGTIGMDGSTIEILKVGQDFYFRGDDAFWKQNAGDDPAILAMFKGKWIKSGKDNKEFSEFASIADVSELLKPDGAVTKGEATTINGVAAITLKDGSGEGALYVATDGEPYPLRLEGPAGEGALDFSEFGATFDEVKAPSAEEIFDLSQIGS